MSRCIQTENFFVSTGPNHLQLTGREPIETEVLDSRVDTFFPTCGQRAGYEKTLDFLVTSNNAFVLLSSVRLDLSLRVMHKDGTEARESIPAAPARGRRILDGGIVEEAVEAVEASERPSRVVLLNTIAHTLWQDIVRGKVDIYEEKYILTLHYLTSTGYLHQWEAGVGFRCVLCLQSLSPHRNVDHARGKENVSNYAGYISRSLPIAVRRCNYSR